MIKIYSHPIINLQSLDPKCIPLHMAKLDYFIGGVSSSSSNNILTWMNSLTNKRIETIYPLIIPIFKQQALLWSQTIREGCKFWWYRLNDAKFIYLLTQHAQWSRTLNPFLLCDCNKGEGVGNDNHICFMVSDDDQ